LARLIASGTFVRSGKLRASPAAPAPRRPPGARCARSIASTPRISRPGHLAPVGGKPDLGGPRYPETSWIGRPSAALRILAVYGLLVIGVSPALSRRPAVPSLKPESVCHPVRSPAP
jgi:hypothetical protein